MTSRGALRYQLNGRERCMGLGSARNFTLAEARKRAKKARQLLDDGIDPIEARLAARDLDAKQARERITFKEATEQFLALHEQHWKNQKHRAQWRSSLKVHAFPILGERPVAAIDQALINAAVAPTRAPETARRVRDRIARICNGSKTACRCRWRMAMARSIIPPSLGRVCQSSWPSYASVKASPLAHLNSRF